MNRMILFRLLPVSAALLAILVVSSPLAAATVSGRVAVESKGRPQPSELTAVVAWFEPAAGASVEAADKPFEVITDRKAFQPRVLIIPKGSTVQFPNRDPILHNVFSVSGPRRFDLGFYGKGPGEAVTFDQGGVVRLFCNVHYGMVGYILVMDTPFFARVDRYGRFQFDDVPAGRGTLTVWHERAEPWQTEVVVPQSRGISVTLDLTRPQVPAHLDKGGLSYKSRGRDRYRRRGGPGAE